MPVRALFLILLLVNVAGLVPAARGALLLSNTLASPTTIDFSQFVAAPLEDVSGPIQIGSLVGEDIVLSGQPLLSSLFAFDGDWGLGGNGIWSDRSGFGAHVPDFTTTGTVIITFEDGLVSGVGAFMNYCPDCDASSLVISAYGADGFQLESWDVTALADIVTPGALNGGAFRGIQRATADIRSFRISGSGPALDDLAFTRTLVPEPGSGALLAFGVTAAALWRRRPQAQVSGRR